MILVSGFNAYPNEFEDVIITHPGVLEVAVIAAPDKRAISYFDLPAGQ